MGSLTVPPLNFEFGKSPKSPPKWCFTSLPSFYGCCLAVTWTFLEVTWTTYLIFLRFSLCCVCHECLKLWCLPYIFASGSTDKLFRLPRLSRVGIGAPGFHLFNKQPRQESPLFPFFNATKLQALITGINVFLSECVPQGISRMRIERIVSLEGLHGFCNTILAHCHIST